MSFAGAGTTNTLTKAVLDNQMGSIISAIDGALLQAHELQQFFLAHVDGDFTASTGAGPTGYVQADVNTMKSAFTDLEQLYQIFIGSQNLASAKDFRAFAKLIAATLVH